VLPRYFNHASFASLRRQLNYFQFVRLGKGRQRESTYINANVVVLDDILSLKRRSNNNDTETASVVSDPERPRRKSPPRYTGSAHCISDDDESIVKHRRRRRRKTSKTATTIDPELLQGCQALLHLSKPSSSLKPSLWRKKCV